MAGVNKVESAVEATDIALAFVKEHRQFARPLKAVREDDIWLVEIDVGPLFLSLAKLKLDARTGKVIEYNIP